MGLVGGKNLNIKELRALVRKEPVPQQRPSAPAFPRPKVRGDCIDGPRPCPYVSCKWHLWADINEKGGMRHAWGTDERALERMPDTCALDVADRGGSTLEQLAQLQAVTRERIRQVEMRALAHLQRITEGLAVDMGVLEERRGDCAPLSFDDFASPDEDD